LKRLLIPALAVILFLSCFGCSSKKELSVDTLSDELINGDVFSETLEPIDLEILNYIYDISDDDYEEAVVYCSSGSTSDELAIFKAKDADALKRIQDAVQKRIDEQISAFQNYVPSAVPKLESAYNTTYGNYVILCVSTDSAAAEEILGKYVK